mgnify:CR=1 FL=1
MIGGWEVGKFGRLEVGRFGGWEVEAVETGFLVCMKYETYLGMSSRGEFDEAICFVMSELSWIGFFTTKKTKITK